PRRENKSFTIDANIDKKDGAGRCRGRDGGSQGWRSASTQAPSHGHILHGEQESGKKRIDQLSAFPRALRSFPGNNYQSTYSENAPKKHERPGRLGQK